MCHLSSETVTCQRQIVIRTLLFHCPNHSRGFSPSPLTHKPSDSSLFSEPKTSKSLERWRHGQRRLVKPRLYLGSPLQHRRLKPPGYSNGAALQVVQVKQYNTIQYHSYIFNPIHICLYLCSSLHSIDSSFHFPFWVSFGFQFRSFCSNFSSLCWVLPPLSYLTSKNGGIGILGLGSAVPKLESCSYII